MNTCSLVFIAIAVVSFKNFQALSKTLTKATNFDDYEVILQQTLDFKQKLRLIEAIWAEIRSDFKDDLDKAGKLYQQLDYTIEAYLAVQNELQAAKELKRELGLHLQSKNAELLAKTWTGFKANEPNAQLQVELQKMLKNFDVVLMTQIYKTAIDLSYDTIEPQRLSAHVRQTLLAVNDKSYETVLAAQLYLFGKFVINGDVSERFLMDIAFYLHKMRRHYFFKNLKENLKRRFWLVIDELPATLRHLFFEPEFCLLNKKYAEYLYAANATKIDEMRRYVFTWGTPNAVNELGVWRMNVIEVAGDDLTLKFNFSSKSLGSVMYLEPSVQEYEFIVAAWRAGGGMAPNRFWSLKLQDDVLIFENEKKLLCATADYYDGRRFVYGRYNEEYNPSTESCQWQAAACPD